MAKDLSAAFAQIEKQSKQMAIEAMREVANKMHKMAIKTAKDCLKRYYASYKPKRYKRTDQLKKAIGASAKPKEVRRGDIYTISFFIKYDANKLKGLYHSNSWYHQSGDVWKPVMLTWAPDHLVKGLAHDSMMDDLRRGYGQNNGVPEPEWILNNYLQGIHPWGQTDAESTDTVMTRFFQQDLPNKAGDMIYAEMQDSIVGFLKTYGGGK
jgi:ribosomal protein L22